MTNITLINPLKPGSLPVFKAFMADITGPRKSEYSDLLKRYGLKNSKVVYHKLAGVEFVVVAHDMEDDAAERLAAWPTSSHPFDVWFKERAQAFYDFELAKVAGQPEVVAVFDPAS
ncbi:MAG: hypothetical protein NTV32_08220 [Gammaproteobacteria bacterium]|nr:hypothetical protein [Gammaproteobacteria bacterium]